MENQMNDLYNYLRETIDPDYADILTADIIPDFIDDEEYQEQYDNLSQDEKLLLTCDVKESMYELLEILKD